ncbi:hypothetical protein BA062_38665 [Prauserella flavalba]|uniref:Uncharacterized protein n=1 Tax=Prauserella flavalba TaxID=1477506 RepID=A0A318LER1_9PSEU|nr:hypothetical protein BA062_38665 [Prauserella flavalba]
MPAGQGGQDLAQLEEPDVAALADDVVPQRLGDVGLADPDRAVEDHRLASGQPAQRAEVADLRGRDLRVDGEVELLDGDDLLEVGGLDPPGDGLGVATGDLVVAEDLQELDVAEFAGAGLGQASVEGLQHPGQLELAQGLLERGVDDHADTPASLPRPGWPGPG